jgi:hypothetical protein
MSQRIKITVLAWIAGAAMALAQSGNVHQAALWQRAKDTVSTRQLSEQKPAQLSNTVTPPAPGDGNVEEAVRWERAKDQADKRQERIEAAAAAKAKKK